MNYMSVTRAEGEGNYIYMGLRCSTVNVCMFLLIIFTRITRIIGHSFHSLHPEIKPFDLRFRIPKNTRCMCMKEE